VPKYFTVALSIGLALTPGALPMALRAQDPPKAPKDEKADTAAKPAAAAQAFAGYRVGVDDELAISVWHEPEFSQLVVVRPDGMITLPLLNNISVVGLTTDEVQALLVEKLKPLVNDPQVTVIVKAVKSQKVYLVGNVAKQGVYPLTGHKTVLELLAEAGGLGPFAKGGSIYVLRKVDGKEVRLPFNYKKALSGKGANPELVPGDMIVVP
jgi:polysaccharide biosynthesis/export protein